MTEIHLPEASKAARESKSLWTAGAVILGVVFAPALVAWVILVLRS